MKQCLLILLGLLPACTPSDNGERVLLVTTTTVEGSGLLDALAVSYHAHQDRYRLATTAVGTGAALEIGRRGDGDILITHDPSGEARFMAAGHGVEQGPVMHSEFIIAGPPGDPAGVRGVTELGLGLARIEDAGARFISRGDDSGTHRKELELWRRAGHPGAPSGAGWYVEAGSGMAESLRIADQRRAYLLTDRSTFRHLAALLELESLARGTPAEANPYQYTIPVDAPHPDGARDFVRWLLGPGRALIGDYGVARFDEPLFLPAAPADGP